jgi:hypothetical protein
MHKLTAPPGESGRIEEYNLLEGDSIIKRYENNDIVLELKCIVLPASGNPDAPESYMGSKLKGILALYSKGKKKPVIYAVDCYCGC